MDFCSWCVGEKEAKHLTGQGQSGGICPEHLAELMKEVAILKAQREKDGKK